MHGFMLNQVIDHRSVFTRELLEALFTSWVGKAADIENEAAAVTGFVRRLTLMKRETEDPDHEGFRFACHRLEFLRRQHALECSEQRRRLDRQFDVMKQPSQVFQCVW